MEKCLLSYNCNLFFSTGRCERMTLFPQELCMKFFKEIIHRKLIHIPQTLWIRFYKSYKEALMLAVMSRMLFLMLLSPPFRAISTLRMAYRTVE